LFSAFTFTTHTLQAIMIIITKLSCKPQYTVPHYSLCTSISPPVQVMRVQVWVLL